jgi:RNA polymerase sigma-70 factor, ECF subfamily
MDPELSGLRADVDKSLALAELLAAVALRDANALRKLHRATHARLLAEARRLLPTRECAEEVLQDAYIAVWRSAARFDAGIARPMTWLLRIVRNRAIDRLRASRPEATRTVSLDDEAGATMPDAGSGDADDMATRLAVVERGLGALERQQRQAVALLLYRGLSQGEIAGLCGVSHSTANAWLQAGVSRLRRYTQAERAAA